MNASTFAPVLFMDFDGVTHPEPCIHESVFCRLHLIEAVLREREFRDVAIAISSSWRDVHSLDDMREFFSSDIRSRVIGVTPSIKNPSSDWVPGQAPQFEREWEIESWLKQHRPWGTRWVAVDDRDYWFRPDSPNLLLTDRQFGFHPDNAATLREMLLVRLP